MKEQSRYEEASLSAYLFKFHLLYHQNAQIIFQLNRLKRAKLNNKNNHKIQQEEGKA